MELKETEKVVAILTIKDARSMDLAGRKMVARGLRHWINEFVEHGDTEFSNRFRYRYLYKEGDYAPEERS